jgi:type IV pilus assembly protein PilM
MLELLTLKPDTFGLDISDLSFKIVQLVRKGKFLRLSFFLEEKIKPGLIKEGEIRNEDELAFKIRAALQKHKRKAPRTRYVVASLPEEKAFLQVIQMPKMPEEDLKSAVIYEAENYIPLPIEEVYLDSVVVKPLVDHLDHFDVLIAALPKKIVNSYLNCLKKAGLFPQVFEIESLAIARALVKKSTSPVPLLLIDLGATRTSFIIFSGYSLKFTSSIPVSSQSITDAIAKNLNISQKDAEKLKIKEGLDSKRIFEAAIPVLTDLSEQIKKHLDYYTSHAFHEHLGSNQKGVSKIILSGGGANLKGLTGFLSDRFKIPVEIGNPWVNILPEPLKEIPELPYSESLKYTTALGLALRGIENNFYD